MNHPGRATGDPPAGIDFTGQVAVITGAGRGLGRLYALDLARRGAAVVVNDLGGTMRGSGSDGAIADRVVDEITAAGGRAVASYDSVDSAEGGQAIIDSALTAFGRVDAVVSNAGIFGGACFEQLSPEDWRRMLRVHLDGGFHLSQPAYRVMMAQGYGRFVFISSSAGAFGQPMEAHYAAAKTGLVGLSNVIAIEGAAHGISSNTVLPTGMSRMVTETVGDETFLAESGFMRAIRPELVVPLVTFLASSACTFTHRNYSACAGRYARVFVGLASGWVADSATEPTAEDIEKHLDEASAVADFIVPDSIVDEVLQVCGQRGISAMPDNAEVAFPDPRG
ncbi:SDR family NAD(P)-dependent oxidoreductase [Mycolicibacterium litorale]|uniref:SDR family NAD(P)-dependent oxidoreductase n=1 Tax=Mycolicibacterium litorale TaxID=758802 RepID=UPI003CF687AB